MCKKDKTEQPSSRKKIIIGSVVAGLFVIGCWLASLVFVTYYWNDWTVRGTFGDSFGAINALFSGLAFAGLIITLIMQRDELKLQRDELSSTREEMEQQRKEFEQQNTTLKLQRFENTFFNMLTLHETITSNLSYVCPDGADTFECSGRQVFERFYYYKIFDFNEHVYGIRSYVRIKGISAFNIASDVEIFDHYFRHLYRIFKFIKESTLIEDEKRYEYACIARSQLSDCELLMLFYNCILPENAKFKALIEEYAIFNNIRVRELGEPGHASVYNQSAYQHIVDEVA